MPKTVSDDALKEMYKKNTCTTTTYTIYISDSETLKYIVNNQNIGVYTAIAAKRTPIKSEEGTVINEVEISLDNVDLAFRTKVINGDFKNKKVQIHTVFLNESRSSILASVLIFEGYFDEPKGDEYYLNLTARPFTVMEREFPKRIYQAGCNWVFCSDECDAGTLPDFAVTTILNEASDGQTFVCSHGKSANYFVPGFLQIISGSYSGKYSPVSSNTTGNVVVRIGLGVTISLGTSVKIQKLCSKSPEDCQNIFDNFSNFGGFPHVPMQPII